MKHFILLLTVFLITYSCIKPEEGLEQRFLKYTSCANQTELCLCEDDFENAKMYFDSLFLIDVKVHAREKYNFGVLSLKLGDTSQAMNVFTDLYQKNYAKKYPFIKKFSSEYSNVESIQEDEELYKKCDEILKTDQIANGKKYFDNEEYFRVVMLNVGKIKQILKGVKDNEYSNFSINTSALYLPIVHYYQFKGLKKRISKNSSFVSKFPIYKHLENKPVYDQELETLLKECMLQGKLCRYTFANFQAMEGFKTGNIVQYQFNDYSVVNNPKYMKDSIIEMLDRNRKSLFLESYSDYFKKAVYTSKMENEGMVFPKLILDIEDREQYYKDKQAWREAANFIICSVYANTFQFNDDEQAKNQAKNLKESFYN